MTTIIELTDLFEHEEGGATVTLNCSSEGMNVMVRYGFVYITLCGMYDMDLDDGIKAIELGAKQLKRDKEVAAELDDTQE